MRVPGNFSRQDHVCEVKFALGLVVPAQKSLRPLHVAGVILQPGLNGLVLGIRYRLIRKELLTSIFAREAVLHDGAVIVRGDRVAAASCFLPLTERSLDLAYGTRHRAAVGISEQSDAVVIVTSEERGQVAVAEGGTLTSFQEPRWLTAHLSVVFAERRGIARAEPAAA